MHPSHHGLGLNVLYDIAHWLAWPHAVLADRRARQYSHEPIEQLAMLRAIPNLNTIRPADAMEVEKAWKLVIEPKADATGSPDLVLMATGSEVSLALETKKLLDAQGIDTRVVSMPCWTLFAKQPQSYRDEVLPPKVTARMSIEAAATFGWSRWVGDKGVIFGIDRFGMSAPATNIAKALGFTPEAVAKLAQESFAFAAR